MKPVIDPSKPDRSASVGLACPRCGCRHLLVAYTRHRPGCIVRARDCRLCGKRIITRERA